MVKVAICDDTDIQRDIVQGMLEEYCHVRRREIELTCFANGKMLLEGFAKNGPFDVCLLDHVMPFMTGIQTAEKITAEYPSCRIVFISSDNNAVFGAFKVKAFDFITKPISVNRFYEVMDRLHDELHAPDDSVFFFRSIDGDRKLPLENIRYFIKDDRSLACHLDDGSVLTGKALRTSVKETLAPLLDNVNFAMCGASIMINLAKVQSVTPEDVIFDSGEYLHIPSRCYSDIHSRWKAI